MDRRQLLQTRYLIVRQARFDSVGLQHAHLALISFDFPAQLVLQDGLPVAVTLCLLLCADLERGILRPGFGGYGSALCLPGNRRWLRCEFFTHRCTTVLYDFDTLRIAIARRIGVLCLHEGA